MDHKRARAYSHGRGAYSVPIVGRNCIGLPFENSFICAELDFELRL
jgi:hypothetical protein